MDTNISSSRRVVAIGNRGRPGAWSRSTTAVVPAPGDQQPGRLSVPRNLSVAVPTLRQMRAQQTGTLGEQAACDALEQQGYRIVHRNYRVRGGELDIVCEHGGTLVFCEVKTRTSAVFGLPEEAITVDKRRRLRRLALEYMQREGRRTHGALRFDVISVAISDGRVGELRHLVNAF